MAREKKVKKKAIRTVTYNPTIQKHVKIPRVCRSKKKMSQSDIINLHNEFFQDLYQASKLDDRPESCLPTFIFLAFSFVLIHRILHKRRTLVHSFQLQLYKELGFQWSFFYLSRIWFWSIKGVHWLNDWLEDQIEDRHVNKQLLWIEYMYIRAGTLTLLTSIALVPLAVFIASSFWKSNIPNFLMWVGEDPWVRSEIGISGHYLDRPPTFMIPKRKEYPYRTKRSISVEYETNNPREKQLPRNCKSLAVFNFD